MIKGCNKRVIVMKETGNAMIEEAFFILRPESGKSISEDDIIKQANRILEKSVYNESFSHLPMNVAERKGRSGRIACFWSGLILGAVITAGLSLII